MVCIAQGDDMGVDPKTGKNKLFEIIVHTPMHILLVCYHLLPLVITLPCLPIYSLTQLAPRTVPERLWTVTTVTHCDQNASPISFSPLPFCHISFCSIHR